MDFFSQFAFFTPSPPPPPLPPLHKHNILFFSRQYRRLALVLHPDKNRHAGETRIFFKRGNKNIISRRRRGRETAEVNTGCRCCGVFLLIDWLIDWFLICLFLMHLFLFFIGQLATSWLFVWLISFLFDFWLIFGGLTDGFFFWLFFYWLVDFWLIDWFFILFSFSFSFFSNWFVNFLFIDCFFVLYEAQFLRPVIPQSAKWHTAVRPPRTLVALAGCKATTINREQITSHSIISNDYR